MKQKLGNLIVSLKKKKARKKKKRQRELKKQENKKLLNNAANKILFYLYMQDEWEIHVERLDKFKKSKLDGEVFYEGKGGGIFTIRGNVIRDYRW